jgi:hypothetical protein
MLNKLFQVLIIKGFTISFKTWIEVGYLAIVKVFSIGAITRIILTRTVILVLFSMC